MEEINYAPTTSYDSADIDRLNTLFDQITEKPFLSPTVAVQAIRAALHVHGILLPKLDVERQIEAPNTMDALSILISGKALPQPDLDSEYLFKIGDADIDEDGDPDLYLYIVLDRVDQIGAYEIYAQVVHGDEVDDLINMNIPQELENMYPELMDNGEVERKGDDFLAQTRHSAGDFGGSEEN